MVVTAVVSQTPAAGTPAKKAKTPAAFGSKKPTSKPTHPKTSEMVNNAIKELKERSGSSLQAIKKYISAQYKVDAEKLAPFIRKYLKQAVESGALIQTKGKGASGSFKLESIASSGAKHSFATKSASGRLKKVVAAAAFPKKKATDVGASPVKAKSTTIKSRGDATAKNKTDAKIKSTTIRVRVDAAAKRKTAAKAISTTTKSRAGAPNVKKAAKPPTKKPKMLKPKKAAAPKAKPAPKKGAAKK